MSTAVPSRSATRLGASGARIMTTLVNALEQRGGRYTQHEHRWPEGTKTDALRN